MATSPFRTQSGFTLMELIIVMVLLGILGAMGAGFISQAFSGFAASDRRLEIYEEGNLAMARMERELQIAVPNAIDVSIPDEIRFGMIDENNMAAVFGQYQATAGGTKIEDSTGTTLLVDTLVSIYNTNWNGFGNGARIYRVASLDGSKMVLDQSIAADSPEKRFFAVRDRAVKLHVDAATKTLYRATAPVSAVSGVGAFDSPGQVLAKNIQKARDPSGNPLSYFTYAPGTPTRNAVVSVAFALARDGEEIAFHKEIQVRNVP